MEALTNCCTNCCDGTKKRAAEIMANPLPFAWLVSCILSVTIPLLIYIICRAKYNEWDEYKADKVEDEYSLGALIFIYLWSLVSFTALVYYGTLFFRNVEEERTFLLVLVVFANASLLGCILSLTNMRALDNYYWDERNFSLFPSLLVITYALWACLGGVFGGILVFRKYSEATSNGGRASYQKKKVSVSPSYQTAYKRPTVVPTGAATTAPTALTTTTATSASYSEME